MRTSFQSLELYAWRQFGAVKIDFHNRLTFLTGRNGTGKSTILRILESHFPLGRVASFAATAKLDESGKLFFASDSVDNYLRYRQEFNDENSVGRLRYDESTYSILSVPVKPHAQYQMSFNGGTPSIPGFAASSEGIEAYYLPVLNIQAQAPDLETFYEKFIDTLRQSGASPDTSVRNLHRIRKEQLVRSFIHGYLNRQVANKDALEIIGSFQDALEALLPSEIGFKQIDVRDNEIVFLTKAGEFSMDTMSHGLSRIVDLAWIGVLLSFSKTGFVLTIDEPENHLHPSMQQKLVSNLVSFFQNAQFIIATHSPLVVTSVRDSNVYVLDISEEENKVNSVLLDSVNKAATANETLRKVLGLDHTMPIWAENILNKIADDLANKSWSEEEIKKVANRLESNGLLDYAPHLIHSVIDRKNEEQK